MITDLSLALLRLKSKRGAPFEVTVSGTSMLPILQPGSKVSVCRKEQYECGDIIVFIYKHNEVLVHRILKIEDDRYFCKGDNSFRLEDITIDQIIGAVMLNNDRNKTEEFIEASYRINRIFRELKYNQERILKTPEYILYKETYLKHCEKNFINMQL